MVKCIQFCFKTNNDKLISNNDPVAANSNTETIEVELQTSNDQLIISHQPVATSSNVSETHTAKENIIKDESNMVITPFTNNSISIQEIEPSVSTLGQQGSITYITCPVS